MQEMTGLAPRTCSASAPRSVPAPAEQRMDDVLRPRPGAAKRWRRRTFTITSLRRSGRAGSPPSIARISAATANPRRHRADPRHHGPQSGRAADRVSGVSRLSDRPREPAPVPGASVAGAGAGAAAREAGGGAVPRSRSLQDRQRLPRAQHRRWAAAGGGAAAEECGARGDTVARVGGDEFTIVLQDLSHRTTRRRRAERAAQRRGADDVKGIGCTSRQHRHDGLLPTTAATRRRCSRTRTQRCTVRRPRGATRSRCRRGS